MLDRKTYLAAAIAYDVKLRSEYRLTDVMQRIVARLFQQEGLDEHLMRLYADNPQAAHAAFIARAQSELRSRMGSELPQQERFNVSYYTDTRHGSVGDHHPMASERRFGTIVVPVLLGANMPHTQLEVRMTAHSMRIARFALKYAASPREARWLGEWVRHRSEPPVYLLLVDAPNGKLAFVERRYDFDGHVQKFERDVMRELLHSLQLAIFQPIQMAMLQSEYGVVFGTERPLNEQDRQIFAAQEA